MLFTVVWVIFTIILLICIACRVYARVNCAWCISNVCLEGKTALVTGGSIGIGYYIVCGLLSRGCKVIVADKIIDENIISAMIKETKNEKLSFEYVDLASFKSTRDLADRLKLTENKLDIVIHNAGIGKSHEDLSEDGLNIPMQVNYYSAFLLTHLLVDLMRKSSAARLIFASSGFAFLNSIWLNKSQPDNIGFGTMQLDYQNSKFCMIVAADIFAEKLEKYNITSNSYHPGVVKTTIINQFRRSQATILGIILGIFLSFDAFLVGKSPIEGAQTALHLACSNEVEGVTGKFFGEATSRFKPLQAYKKQLCQALWLHSERIVKLKPEECIS